MKELAAITVLAVIPAFVTDLLGENLLDLKNGEYFGAYLWQVVIFVIIGMFLVTYIFAKLGWLKT